MTPRLCLGRAVAQLVGWVGLAVLDVLHPFFNPLDRGRCACGGDHR